MSFLRGSRSTADHDIGKSPTWDSGRPHNVIQIAPDRAAAVRRLNKSRQILLQDIDNAKFS